MKYTIAFAALIGAAIAAPLATSARQGVMYTDENGVEYYQDPATGQWYYYPSPSPSPAPATAAPTPEPVPGSGVALESGTAAEAKGDISGSVAADESSAAASGNGLNGVIAAAAATPGTPAGLVFSF